MKAKCAYVQRNMKNFIKNRYVSFRSEMCSPCSGSTDIAFPAVCALLWVAPALLWGSVITRSHAPTSVPTAVAALFLARQCSPCSGSTPVGRGSTPMG